MPAETVKCANIYDITCKGKVEENKDGDRKQVTTVQFEYVGSAAVLDPFLLAIENKADVNVSFGLLARLTKIHGLSLKSKIDEDKDDNRTLVAVVQFDYKGNLQGMDKVLLAVTKYEKVDATFETDQYAMVNLSSGEISNKVKCKGCPILEECPVEVVHDSTKCKALLKERGEV